VIAVFHLLAAGLFFLARTTPLGAALPFLAGYDIFAVYVLFLAFFRSAREGTLCVTALAAVLDLVSSAPFGLHVLFYAVEFAVARRLLLYIEARNVFFLALAVLVSVCAGDVLFFGFATVMGGRAPEYPLLFQRLGHGAAHAVTTGWAVPLVLDGGARRWEVFWAARFAKDANGRARLDTGLPPL
jgi:cell shape-determining protein MreD